MRAILLDCAESDDARTREAADGLERTLKARGADVERIFVRELDVKACTGCFGCWTRTPGECVIDDDARRVAERVIAADVFAIVSPIVFGSYGWRAKGILDRLICLVLPHFTMLDGEVHHRPRYERYPHLLALGTLEQASPQQAELFARLVERNAVNLHNPTHAAVAVSGDQALPDAVSRLLDSLPAGLLSTIAELGDSGTEVAA